MRFENDPKVDDLSAVGDGEGTLVARRFHAGVAFRWEPGGDANALVAFVGSSLVAVEGKVFFREPNGSLSPMDVNRKMVVVKPPAGEPFFVEHHEFTTQFAQVAEDRAVIVAPDVAPSIDEEPEVVKRGPGCPKKVVSD